MACEHVILTIRPAISPELQLLSPPSLILQEATDRERSIYEPNKEQAKPQTRRPKYAGLTNQRGAKGTIYFPSCIFSYFVQSSANSSPSCPSHSSMNVHTEAPTSAASPRWKTSPGLLSNPSSDFSELSAVAHACSQPWLAPAAHSPQPLRRRRQKQRHTRARGHLAHLARNSPRMVQPQSA